MEDSQASAMNEPNQDALVERVRAEFPELQWQHCEMITEGWDHAVLILDRRHVFRFPLEEDHERSLSSEIEFLGALRPFVDAKVPDYKYIAKDVSFAGYDIVTGKQLFVSEFNCLSDDERDEIARQIATFLTSFHTFEAELLAALPLLPFYVPAEQAEIRHSLDVAVRPHLSDEDFAFARAIMDEVDEVIAGANWDTAIHGDIYSRHLLWDVEAHRLGVIDFSDRGRGDPAMDFAELHEYGFDFVERVYGYYQGPKDDTFLSRAWTYQKWVAVYMLTDHFDTAKTTFAVAREDLDRVKRQQAGHGNSGDPFTVQP